MGYCEKGIRLPLTTLSAKYQEIIEKDILELDI